MRENRRMHGIIEKDDCLELMKKLGYTYQGVSSSNNKIQFTNIVTKDKLFHNDWHDAKNAADKMAEKACIAKMKEFGYEFIGHNYFVYDSVFENKETNEKLVFDDWIDVYRKITELKESKEKNTDEFDR